MWRVKTVTKFKNSFFPVLIYWNDNRIYLGIIKNLNFPIWFSPLILNCFKQVKVLRKELREREKKAMESILSRAEVKDFFV